MNKNSIIMGTALAFALGACNFAPAGQGDEKAASAANSQANAGADPFLSHDDVAPTVAEDTPRPIMQAQVLLDRLGFAPGVIDGKMGMSTVNAIKGFQEANDITVTGELDDKTKAAILAQRDLPATRMVSISESFASQTFIPMPAKAEDKAKLANLGYENIVEALAERFHTTPDILRSLNPVSGAAPAAEVTDDTKAAEKGTSSIEAKTANDAAIFAVGKTIRVPNIGGDAVDPAIKIDEKWRKTLVHLGVGTGEAQATKIVVDESDSVLKAFDSTGKLLAQFTATMGSQHDPLPIGSWKVNGVAYNPPFTYNPKLFWDVADNKPKLQFKPGPNSPVGVVWIDLSKPHYGIHGTPSPETIGRAESHGCVRLTNWDAARLAMMVKPDTQVIFQK